MSSSEKSVLLQYAWLGRPVEMTEPATSMIGGKRKLISDEPASDGEHSDIPMSESVSPMPAESAPQSPIRVQYDAFEVHNPATGRTDIIRVNSTVRVNSGNEGGNYFIALVEEIFSEVGSTEGGVVGRKRRRTYNVDDDNRSLITAKDMTAAKVVLRWYFQARDIPNMGLSQSSPEAKDLIDTLSKTNSNGSSNIALSELRDVNPLDVILGPIDIPKEFVVSHVVAVVPHSSPLSWEISKFDGGGGPGGDGRGVDEDAMEGEDSDSEDSTTSSSSDDTNAGKIYIGDNHQAVVPEVIPDYHPSRPPPTQVWKPDPGSVNPKALKTFISSCYEIIKGAVPESSDYSVKGQNDDVTFEDSLDFGDTVHPCDMSVILEVLALNSYDIDKAKEDVISRVSDFVEEMTKKKSAEAGGKQEGSPNAASTHTKNTTATSPPPTPSTSNASRTTPLSSSNPTPQVAMFWTKNEKSLFNAGFKKHTGQLRNISLGLPSKSTSEVIDYHYRFKIPSQYRKYVKKKRTTSSTNGPGGSTSSTPFSSTSHSPFDNGSGPTAIDRRRHKQAKSFLSQCRRQLGPEAYLNVVNLLKSYSQKSIQMKNLRERVVRVIGGGELAKNFDTFLPKKHRGEEGA